MQHDKTTNIPQKKNAKSNVIYSDSLQRKQLSKEAHAMAFNRKCRPNKTPLAKLWQRFRSQFWFNRRKDELT